MFSFIKKLFHKKKKQKLNMIVAIDEQNGIGYKGKLLFSPKEDMHHFTQKTTGGVVIMGSTTYESIPEKFCPLKNRINIVLHKEAKNYPGKNIFVVHSINEAVKKAQSYGKEIWVMGGASIYKQMLPLVDELEITQFFAHKKADTFFPEFRKNFELITTSEKMFDEKESVAFQFQTWERKK